MKTDVIIPARNEQFTVGAVVAAFKEHPEIGRVTVSIDADTKDDTLDAAEKAGADIVYTPAKGKGQVIKEAVPFVTTNQVILCDADVDGLTVTHVQQLLGKGLVIGVPDIPIEEILTSNAVIARPGWFNRILKTWHEVSGQRNVPTDVLIGLELHGYLTEVQINDACERLHLPPRYTRLQGLHSPFLMTKQRLEEMERDRRWGIGKGILAE
jgi:hypothetical protein